MGGAYRTGGTIFQKPENVRNCSLQKPFVFWKFIQSRKASICPFFDLQYTRVQEVPSPLPRKVSLALVRTYQLSNSFSDFSDINEEIPPSRLPTPCMS